MGCRALASLPAAIAVLWLCSLSVHGTARAEVTETLLRASDKAQSDNFGDSVSLVGDVALIGAPQIGKGGAGAAYVFRWDGSAWSEEQKLEAPVDDRDAGDAFGAAVALGSESLAVIGAFGDDETAGSAGAAYIYRYNGTSWVLEQKLLAGDGVGSDEFGNEVAMDGDTAVVGARRDNHSGLSDPGSVYVFVYDGMTMTWLESARLDADDAAAKDELGIDVAIDGSMIAAGAWRDDDGGSESGSVYTLNAPQHKLVAADDDSFDWFGRGLDIRGDVLAVGAPGDDDAGDISGSVYVYRDPGSGFAFEQKLTASDADGQEEFGFSLALGNATLVVGAYLQDDNGVNAGAGYVYRYDGSSWVEEYKLNPTGPVPGGLNGGEQLGFDVAVDGNRVLLGAPLDDLPTNAGSAWLFDLPPAPVPATSPTGRMLLGVLLLLLASWAWRSAAWRRWRG